MNRTAGNRQADRGSYVTPNRDLPEVAPVRPLTWLGPAPADAFVKPGHEVLDAVLTFVSRFSAFPNEHCAPTLASKVRSRNEDLRALLNAGYKRTATVARCVGDAKSMNVTRFPVYAPVALAGIAGGMYALIKVGEIIPVRVGRLRRVRVAALDTFTARLLGNQHAA